MKAIAVFPADKKVRLIDHPVPEITTATEVKLKVLEVGICGTDREICQFKYGTPPKGESYLIIGHEMLGEVVEVGKAVSNFKVGDLAVMMVRRPCHHEACLPCHCSAQDFCSTGDFTERGINGRHGFMTEYVVDDECYMVSVPNALKPIAVLTEPLTISEKMMREIKVIQKRLPWDMKSQQYHALVVGAGPVGLLAAHVFLQNNFKVSVYSLESVEDFRAKIAIQLGAQYFSGGNANDFTALTGPFDVIFDGSGAADLCFQLMPLLNYNGIAAWTGIPGSKQMMDVPCGSLMRDMVLKNQLTLGSVNANRADFESAIVDLQALQSCMQTFPLSLIKRYKIDEYEKLLLLPPEKNAFKNALSMTDTL